MEQLHVLTTLNFCRICLTEDVDSYVSIFQQIKGQNITTLLKEISGDMVFIDDCIPNIICTTCVQNLTIATNLRRQLIESEGHFRDIVCDKLNEDTTTTSEPVADEILEVDEKTLKNIIKSLDQLPSEIKIQKILLRGCDEIVRTDYTPDQLLDNGFAHSEIEEKIVDHSKEFDETTDFKNIEVKFVERPSVFTERLEKLYKSAETGKKRPCIPKRLIPFYKKNPLDNDMEITLEEVERACCMCKTVCKTKAELMQHVETHEVRQNQMVVNEVLETVESSENIIKCKMCFRSFNSLNTFRIHLEKQYFKKTFICEKCGAEFARNRKLIVHNQKMHSDDTTVDKIACNICSKMISEKLMQSHLKNHTRIKIGKFPCKICRKVFTEKQTLRQHAKTHSQFRAFSCQMCNKKFYSNAHLQNHIRVHNNNRKFACSFCAKTFIQCTDRNRHMKVHTGERPHPCQVCPNAYIKRYDLTQHMHKNHPGVLPYKCTTCSTAFLHKSELDQHHLQAHNPNLITNFISN